MGYGGPESETGNPTSVAMALAYCKVECAERRTGCTGFYFTKHANGHEICNLYFTPLSASNLVTPNYKYKDEPWLKTCIMQSDAVQKTTTTTTTTDSFPCYFAIFDPSKKSKKNPAFTQHRLTNGCPDCFGDPKYGGPASLTGNPTSVGKALAYCKVECAERRTGCTGFHFTKHPNGHEICNLYFTPLSASYLVPPGQLGEEEPWLKTCIRQTDAVQTA